jgi:hypothetical protein
MGRTTELRRAVAVAFVPMAEAAGFVTDRRSMPGTLSFRRTAGGRVHIVELQWDGYGRPRFVLNYGTCAPEGLRIDDRLHAPEDVAAGWLPDSGRLLPRRGLGPRDWFRQDRRWVERLLGRTALRPAAEVAAELVALFPQVLAHFDGAPPGPEMRATWPLKPGA